MNHAPNNSLKRTPQANAKEIPILSYDANLNPLETFKSIKEAADSIGWLHQKFNYYVRHNRNKALKDCKAINGVIYRREDVKMF